MIVTGAGFTTMREAHEVKFKANKAERKMMKVLIVSIVKFNIKTKGHRKGLI